MHVHDDIIFSVGGDPTNSFSLFFYQVAMSNIRNARGADPYPSRLMNCPPTDDF